MTEKVKRRPCKHCPWIRGNRLGRIPGYDEALHRRLIEVVNENSMIAMACHNSEVGKEYTCSGAMIAKGFDYPAHRLLAMRGIDHPDNHELPDGMELYEDLRDTLLMRIGAHEEEEDV